MTFGGQPIPPIAIAQGLVDGAPIGGSLIPPSAAQTAPVNGGAGGLPVPPGGALIARDVVTIGVGSSGMTQTWAHTCSGSNRLLFVVFFANDPNIITGVTYNLVPMTQDLAVRNPTDEWVYIFHLVNPAPGTNNVVVSSSSAQAIGSPASVSYMNCGSAQPDVAAQTFTSDSTNQNGTITTINNNDWVFAIYRPANGTASFTAGLTSLLGAFTGMIAGDSNGPVSPPGAFAATGHSTSTAQQTLAMLAFAPAA